MQPFPEYNFILEKKLSHYLFLKKKKTLFKIDKFLKNMCKFKYLKHSYIH